MSTTKHNDGGPAFPCPVFHDPGRVKRADQPQGMTLRDWFAGQALASMSLNTSGVWPKDGDRAEREIRGAVSAAYLYADAMIAAREVKP